ncbi:hypothetical protein QWE_11361 [Agrobacterium albertimagni AOL15]|uniref:Uncharacterized protein n=1 Tax=Agrobacterium albertimagni AOL15 TaxID=1156935 RepID=K2PEP9_9HYPH|nr:hypothetical protein [Agrobacterium albertimagni]EKF59393.1 hypothetical protein QWE_11361 [Agrobacterium albertimagni AOL15]
MTTGQQIFVTNAQRTLRNIGMAHLDSAHGAAVDAVRWCMAVRGRPTHHRLAFLESEAPALLAYLERVADSGDSASWRTMEERIRVYAEVLRDSQEHPCARPWLAAIWHTLPELAAIGQTVLDRAAEKRGISPDVMSAVKPSDEGSGEGEKGSGGKSGASGTAAKPRPSSRLALPMVTVTLTEQEMKVLDLAEDTSDDAEPAATLGNSTDNGDGPGPKAPGMKP